MNIDQLISHLKKLTSTLSPRQLAGLAAVFVGVVAVVVGSAYWISAPQYTLLVADMDAETAQSVVGKLKTQKIQYQLSEDGRSVSVPVERAAELRLDLASNGLPSAGRIGFEIFDRTAFGTTEFLEHVNYRRALEGELARTISTLSEVASARVHISMAKDSLFVSEEQPAKASVVLKLKNNNRPLATSTIKGIAGLVAASVEQLRPESVVILDVSGRYLTKPADGSDSAATGLQLEKQQQIERDLVSKVTTLLEPVVGPGRVRVNVAALLKSDSVEEEEVRYDPASVVVARQTNTETGTAILPTGGVAGARANQPPALSTSAAETNAAGAAQTAQASGGAASTAASGPLPPGRSSEAVNYNVGKVTRHTISPQGQLARLSVAVVLDDERVTTKGADGTAQTTTKPWDAAGIQRIQGIVSAAVGLDQERGDQLTVENIAFDAAPETPEPPPAGFGTQVTDIAKEHWPAALRGLAIFLVAVFALFGVLRPLARRATGLASAPALPAPTASAARLPTVQEMEGQIEAELDAMAANSEGRRLPVLTQRVAKLANDEPEQLARIVRGWIAEERR
ncbi:MAG TPA: flagellar basal-body MS-ring/collar protein FliF [Vicinamibacterales bacterium]|nr:flagellar basal-body MS-ring/collar protein FliF [Vicinamibacterales bacterium]